MDKIIVVAATHVQYTLFCKRFDLNPREHIYARSIPQMHGRHWDTQVIILEGYHYNPNVTLEFMMFMEKDSIIFVG